MIYYYPIFNFNYPIIFVERQGTEILEFKKKKISKLTTQTLGILFLNLKKKSMTSNSTYALELVKSVNIHMLMSGWEDIKP